MSAALDDGERLFEWRALSPRSWLVRGNGGNSIVIADGRDVLHVDTKELGYGGALRREIQRVLGRAVTCVVSTHHHTDHAMGNIAFASDVPIVAQRKSRARTIARAARALADAEHELRVGSLAVELHHVGAGHTDNDVFLVVPEERVVVAADLVYDGLHPIIDVSAGASTLTWRSGLSALETASARLAKTGAGRDVQPARGESRDHARRTGG